MKYINTLFVIASSLLAVMSCAKQEIAVEDSSFIEEEAAATEDAAFKPLVIYAEAADDITKTTYSGENYEFSWNVGDYVAVQVYKGGDSSKPDQIKFQAQTADASTTLVQVGTDFDLTTAHDADGFSNKSYTLGDYAFYPKYASDSNNDLKYIRNASGSGDGDSSTDYLTLFESVPYVSGNPTSVIPIIGKKESGDGTPNAVYKFKTATGILKVSLKQIPAGATKLVITSKAADDKLSGEWLFSDDTYTDGIVMGTGNKSYTNSKTVTFSGLSGLDTFTDFYVPIPVGAINGIIIDIKKDDNTLLWRVSADAILTISRGVVTELPAIDMTSKSLVFAAAGTSNSPTISISQSGFSRVCVNVTSSPSNTPSAYPAGFHFSGDASYSISDWDELKTPKLLSDKSSGLYYMHYVALSSAVNANTLSGLDDKRVKAYGTVPFYYLSNDSVAAYIGEYDITYTTGNTSLTLATSDNPVKGNVMLTEFAGTTGKLYGIYTGGENTMNLVFENTYDTPFASNTYIYSSASDLNFCLGYTRTDQANYDSHAWDLICWNAYTTFEVYGGSTTYYSYVRGNRK